jgi:hypothetical protein
MQTSVIIIIEISKKKCTDLGGVHSSIPVLKVKPKFIAEYGTKSKEQELVALRRFYQPPSCKEKRKTFAHIPPCLVPQIPSALQNSSVMAASKSMSYSSTYLHQSRAISLTSQSPSENLRTISTSNFPFVLI